MRVSLAAACLLAAACSGEVREDLAAENPGIAVPPDMDSLAKEDTAEGSDEGFDPARDACGASDYQGLVGQNIAAVTLPADLNDRVIAPDQAVTQDYRPDRLNIHVDEDGLITELHCG